ncbi:MAG: L-lactate dehydrogenase 1 [Sodalis sp.]|nr:MAG: L-lactate dehydrogenase 1 [Sodalis sp.]
MAGGFNGIFLIATNPCDTIGSGTAWIALPSCLGHRHSTGTDRLRRLLAKQLDVAPQSIDAFIVGEHGDNQFPAWSHCAIYGILRRNSAAARTG